MDKQQKDDEKTLFRVAIAGWIFAYILGFIIGHLI